MILSGVAAPCFMILAIVVAGAFHPEYSHLSQFVSELGAAGAPNPGILNFGGLIPAGALTVLFAIAMGRRLGPGRAVALSALLVAVLGIGRLIAGLAPCDPGCSMEALSVSGRIHAAAGMTALFASVIAPLALAVGLRTHRSRLGRTSMWLGLAGAAAFFILVRWLDGPFVGGAQRLLLALSYGWIVLVAVHLLRVGRVADPRQR
jgi:hypothetical protein